MKAWENAVRGYIAAKAFNSGQISVEEAVLIAKYAIQARDSELREKVLGRITELDTTPLGDKAHELVVEAGLWELRWVLSLIPKEDKP